MKDCKGRERTCRDQPKSNRMRRVYCDEPAIAVVDRGGDNPFWACVYHVEKTVKKDGGVVLVPSPDRTSLYK